jgi:hypothetical protein
MFAIVLEEGNYEFEAKDEKYNLWPQGYDQNNFIIRILHNTSGIFKAYQAYTLTN